jgi:hypothetical protein
MKLLSWPMFQEWLFSALPPTIPPEKARNVELPRSVKTASRSLKAPPT